MKGHSEDNTSDTPPPPRRTGAAWLRIGLGVVDFLAAAAFLYFRPGTAGQMAALCLATLGVFYLVRGFLALRM